MTAFFLESCRILAQGVETAFRTRAGVVMVVDHTKQVYHYGVRKAWLLRWNATKPLCTLSTKANALPKSGEKQIRIGPQFQVTTLPECKTGVDSSTETNEQLVDTNMISRQLRWQHEFGSLEAHFHNHGDTLKGKRVSVFWEEDHEQNDTTKTDDRVPGNWYKGKVMDYDSVTHTHTVHYDDGDVEKHHLCGGANDAMDTRWTFARGRPCARPSPCKRM